MTQPTTVLAQRQKELAGYLIAGYPKLGLAGLSPRGAAAVAGNATQENQCAPITYGPKDHDSDGAFQHRLGRLTELKSWGVKNCGRWDTLEAQAAFCLFELKRDYSSLYRQLQVGVLSLETLTANFCNVYERPAKASANLNARIQYARDTQALMAGVVVSTRPPVSKPAAAASGAIVVVAAAAAGGVQWLGGSWWMTALILASGAMAGFAIFSYFRKRAPVTGSSSPSTETPPATPSTAPQGFGSGVPSDPHQP